MNDKLWFLQSVLPSRLVLIGRQNSTICHTYTSIQCERRWNVYTRKKYKLIFIYDVHVLCACHTHTPAVAMTTLSAHHTIPQNIMLPTKSPNYFSGKKSQIIFRLPTGSHQQRAMHIIWLSLTRLPVCIRVMRFTLHYREHVNKLISNIDYILAKYYERHTELPEHQLIVQVHRAVRSQWKIEMIIG